MAVASLVAGVVVAGFWNSARARIKRTLRAAQLASVADAPEDVPIKLVGRLRIVGNPLRAPFSKRKCAAWFVRVDIDSQSQDGKTFVEGKAQSFELEDETGRALIEVTDTPLLELVVDAHHSSGVLDDPAPHLQEFLHHRGHATRGWIFNKSIRYREGVLEAGERVAVLGVASRQIDPAPNAVDGYRSKSKRLVLRAPRGARLLMTDDPSLLAPGRWRAGAKSPDTGTG
jgi:hypothetical protein